MDITAFSNGWINLLMPFESGQMDNNNFYFYSYSFRSLIPKLL